MPGKNSIGAVALDLEVNGRNYKKQVKDIESSSKQSFARIGKAAAATFSVVAISKFVGSCLSLGSALTEVQNVVDVAFPTMNSQINDFAKNAITNFGMSETLAKRYTGTFGSMAQSFKFTEKEAADMSTTLTGLVGDVASFYDMNHDEAYTKLKSVFTGETESLKDLGVVMTQTALDAYAMENGFNKTTKAMTEQEKVLLRYQFVQDQLKFATGDFVRTQDSWANQTRMLTLRWDSFKASIGKGLIALFTPIVKGINWVMSNLQVLADSFASLMEMLTGYSGDSGGGALAEATGDMGMIDETAQEAGDSVGAIGDGASAAAKKIQKAFAKVDTINKLSFGSDDSQSGSSGSTGGGASSGSVAEAVKFPEATKQASVFDGMLKGIVDEFKRLSNIFINGFKLGFGDSFKDLERMKKYVFDIGESLIDIFTDPKVLNSASRMVDSTIKMWGSKLGMYASLGTTAATLVTGSIATYLKKNTSKIQKFLVNYFDIKAETNEILSSWYATIAEIGRVFASPAAIGIGSNLIQSVMDGAMGMIELFAKLGRDILDTLTGPIIENKDKIIKALEETLKPIEKITGTIAKFIEDTFKKIHEVYDTYVRPAFEKIKESLTSILSTILDNYNEYIAPVLNYIAEGFGALMEEHIQPAVNKLIEFIGKVIEVGATIIEYLTPLINFFIDVLGPTIATVLKVAWDIISGFAAFIFDTIGFVIDTFTIILDFLMNVFSGDWEGAWTNIQELFGTIWEGMCNFVSGIIDLIFSFISDGLDSISSVWNDVWDGIGSFFSGIWEDIQTGVDTAITNVKDTIDGVLNTIRGIWENMWSGLGNFVSDTWNWILGLFTSGGRIFDGIVGSISDVFKTVVNAIIDGMNKVIGIPFGVISDVLGNIHNLKLPVIGKPFTFVPNGINIPQIPRLAQGGYVKANTPQLAMIGDNRHQGEVVAPESKLLELAQMAIEGSKETRDSQGLVVVISLLKELIALVKGLYLSVDIDAKKLAVIVKQAENELSMLGGV